jgi:[ribosomal protein S5]-alanine N-acetyltransferase
MADVSRQIVLATERLQVTSWLPEDVDDLHDLHADPLTMRWVRRGRPETRQETEALLARYLHEQQDRGWTKWRVADRAGALIGRAGFGPYGSSDGRELGYTMRRNAWGRGLATEVAAGLIDWHRRHSDTELWAFAAVRNPASRRVLDKVGFTSVGPIDRNGVRYMLYHLDR